MKKCMPPKNPIQHDLIIFHSFTEVTTLRWLEMSYLQTTLITNPMPQFSTLKASTSPPSP